MIIFKAESANYIMRFALLLLCAQVQQFSLFTRGVYHRKIPSPKWRRVKKKGFTICIVIQDNFLKWLYISLGLLS